MISKTSIGGQQSYCCDGFVPSPSYSTDDLDLVGQNGITKRKSKGGKNPACVAAVETGALILGKAFLAYPTDQVLMHL